ncbi:14418_t:CDS:2 [Dentiscutata erythropus]|uniref:14418_t:CDS:1 n=1 Tax=Dentiscutata erythropus TaxID=1348616 RepID=A0A9N9I877_9GLOM|nr:14418_t:CDS:2 [Dentiscutata erythropus]
MATNIINPYLITDVLIIILKNLGIRDLLSALQVNREWSQVAVPMYWRAPFSYTKKRSLLALKIYRLFLEQKNDQKNSSQITIPTLYDYPFFLKELNYTNLLELDKEIINVKAILKMMTDREIRLNTFIMDNTGTNKETIYGLWARSCYAPIFSSLVHVEIHAPFRKNGVIKALADNCTKLFHLDINLYDNSIVHNEELLNDLSKLFSAQKRLLNIRLIFPNGPGKMLIKILQSRFESFKHLELAKWNFNDCDWKWLKKCSNLTEFAITNPQIQVSDILGNKYEIHRLKISKNSKITTTHWCFDKNDKIPSVSNFYFHPVKPSVEPYHDESEVVIKPLDQ